MGGLGSAYLGQAYLGRSGGTGTIRVPGLGSTYLGRPYLGGIPFGVEVPVEVDYETLTVICHVQNYLHEWISELVIPPAPSNATDTGLWVGGGFVRNKAEFINVIRNRFEIDEKISEIVSVFVKDILSSEQIFRHTLKDKVIKGSIKLGPVKTKSVTKVIDLPAEIADLKIGDISDDDIIAILVSLGEF